MTDRFHDSDERQHTESPPAASGPDLNWTRWPATWVYLVCSGLDIALTYQLLATQDHIEINPVARYFIHGWGLKGMVWFKLIMTGFVLSLVHTLLQKSRVRARVVITLGAVLVGSVVTYSTWLLCRG